MNNKNTEETSRGQYESYDPQPHGQTTVNEGTGPRAPQKNK